MGQNLFERKPPSKACRLCVISARECSQAEGMGRELAGSSNRLRARREMISLPNTAVSRRKLPFQRDFCVPEGS